VPDRCPSCSAPWVATAARCAECGAFPDDALAPPPPEEAFGAPVAAAPLPSRRAAAPVAPRAATPAPPAPARPAAEAAGSRIPPPPRAEFPRGLEGYRERLRETFGYPEFRDGQSRVLGALGEGDVLAVMPTGSGKSLCYVLPALAVGRTLVVSPLIALMQDQVESLQAAGVAATFINSNLDRAEQNRRYAEFIAGRTALLYVAPERFANAAFTAGLARAGVNLLAVDEAHCISEWGHNFRPDYLQLGPVRERLGNPRTLALTATANPQVRRDIAVRLGIAGRATEVVTTVDRPNLTYAVERQDSVDGRRRWIIDYARERRGLAGIVYARTRRGVEEMAEALQNAGVPAEAYHAGLPAPQRSRVQRAFTVGDIPLIVATNAFGMGIDKPDVRYVIHLNMPGRLEAYYQEAGRAGRDGEPSECTLLYARADRRFQQQFIDDAHPDDAAVREVWKQWVGIAEPETGRLPYDVGNREPEAFGMVVSALRDSGLLDPTSLRLTSFDPAAAIDTTSIREHRAYAEARLREMAEYAETSGCRRATILRYFGEEATEGCGSCDNCLGRHEADSAEEYPADLYDRLIAIRDAIARRGSRDPFLVFENRTARELATYRPRDLEALRGIWGIGERRASWFGAELLAAIEEWEAEHPEAVPPVLVTAQRPPAPRGTVRDAGPDVSPDDPLFTALRAWRSDRARSEGVPAYTLFSDRTLRELVAQRPTSLQSLARVWGLGESRVNRFGGEIIEVVRSVERLGPAAYDRWQPPFTEEL
jgi:ATP-dependent DNA helicase RecQ